MISHTNEQALESSIEKVLTGTTQEKLKARRLSSNIMDDPGSYFAGNGYYTGNPYNFNPQFAIDEERFWHFLETTHEKELKKLQRYKDWKRKILERFDRKAKKYGILSLLRKGLEVDDAIFTLFYPYPLASSSPRVKENFEKNEFSVTRQVQYSTDNSLEEIDMVLFINGIPFATMELKNPWTGQNARVHGQNQYKKQRDNRQPLLQFGRCLVHLAVDTDEVYMTTKLKGKQTYFLPFNKGHNHGKGNPPNEHGHKTEYLWKEVLRKESIANIIQHFVRMDGKPADSLDSRTLFFPRYHQLNVVRKLIADVSAKGLGKTYLIEHSAGSGKSNSITWLAFQLIEVYPENASIPGSNGTSSPLFDSVVVVTDRRVLDKQLRDNIKEFSQVKNIVAPAYNSQELKSNLERGKKVIITTIQKFPVIVDGVSDMSDKRFGVIIDEAHSSQGGLSAGKMNQALGQNLENEEYFDAQDMILETIRSRKMKSNASYFAFTATPKNSTLERFGIQKEDGTFAPFHLYSMKQAIEEGFILDVLTNYTSYRSYYEIQKSIEDNPAFESMKAQKKLKAYVEKNPSTIATKAEIMMDHFIKNIINTKKLKGKAKGMVLTQSIESAINYYFAIDDILKNKGRPFKVLIAFSGQKTVRGNEYTEAGINGFSDKDTKENFDKDEYRLLVVANKFLTGFDQPKLCCMYVDKKLQGVMAVQALSRLNRAADKLGKKKEDIFILDFMNEANDIKSAFDQFYTSTTLSEPTDINILHELKEQLDEVGVYEWNEVEQFNEMYFRGEEANNLSPLIDTAADRFNTSLDLEELDKADFKIKAKQFVKIYGQMAAIIPFEMIRWEQLFWFLKFLIPKLVITDQMDDDMDDLLESVDLSSYGIERVKLNNPIELDDSNALVDPQNPNPRGAHDEPEEDPLDLIVRSFNERWFQGWDATPEEQRVKFVNLAENMRNHPDYKEKYQENPDPETRELAFTKIFEDVVANQRKTELDLYRKLAKDESFKQAMQDTLKRILKKAS